MADPSGILARGPWDPGQITTVWRDDPYEPSSGAAGAADVAMDRLRDRGSPSHDGYAARMAAFQTTGEGLELTLQPARWSLRLNAEDASQAMSAMCIVRDHEGRWLAGRRAMWLATWAGRWALGAAGSVEVAENPVETLTRELQEEWSVQAQRLRVEALVRTTSSMVLLVGQAWLPEGAVVTPDSEHDDFAWWPADPAEWPAEADEPLLRTAAMLVSAADGESGEGGASPVTRGGTSRGAEERP